MGSPNYHKINSIQKRVLDGPDKGHFTGEWSDPNFEELQDLHWVCREKIDGTNIRIHVQSDPEQSVEHTDNPLKVSIGGRTDNAQIPKPLLQRLYDLVGILPAVDGMVNPDQTFDNFRSVFDQGALETGVTIYGEGYGAGIQKGGGYGPVDFIVFDVRIGGMWLNEESITGIAASLGLNRVPVYEQIQTLRDAISIVSRGTLLSHWAEYGEAEGIVAIPVSGILDRRGNRIIAKVKGVDFPNRKVRA